MKTRRNGDGEKRRSFYFRPVSVSHCHPVSSPFILSLPARQLFIKVLSANSQNSCGVGFVSLGRLKYFLDVIGLDLGQRLRPLAPALNAYSSTNRFRQICNLELPAAGNYYCPFNRVPEFS